MEIVFSRCGSSLISLQLESSRLPVLNPYQIFVDDLGRCRVQLMPVFGGNTVQGNSACIVARSWIGGVGHCQLGLKRLS